MNRFAGSGFFITGSDTGIGKTHIGCQIVRQLAESETSVKVRKPIESGCKIIHGERVPQDGQDLFVANRRAETLTKITPYRFLAALAPDRAAHLEGQSVSLEQLHAACLDGVDDSDFLVVEGAGGFYSPICSDGLNADLAKLLGLEVVIIAPDRLGGINQALLCLNAVRSEGLQPRMVVLNQCEPVADQGMDNLADLRKRCDVPVHHCGFSQHLDFSGVGLPD